MKPAQMRAHINCTMTQVGGKVSSKYGTSNSGSLCNLFELAFVLASFIFARYTVLRSPNKNETTVLSCDPTLSVLVAFVSCKVNFFYIVSALLSCLYVSKKQ